MAERPDQDEADGDLSYLMVWYGDIRAQALRGQHYEPIMIGEVQAYEYFLSKLDMEMTAFDWHIIFRLDAVWRDCVPKSPEEERAKSHKKKLTQH